MHCGWDRGTVRAERWVGSLRSQFEAIPARSHFFFETQTVLINCQNGVATS